MKTDQFKRSDNVEDYRDPNKPVENKLEGESIAERLALFRSQMAKDVGLDDVKPAREVKFRSTDRTPQGTAAYMMERFGKDAERQCLLTAVRNEGSPIVAHFWQQVIGELDRMNEVKPNVET